MAAITRSTQKIFGGSLSASGNVAQIGSTVTGTPVYSTSLATIQALSAYLNGFGSQVVNGTASPVMQEFNALFLMVTQQIAYILERGLPEWDSGTTYYTYDRCRVGGVEYESLQDSNLNKDPATQTNYWKVYDPSPVGEVKMYAGATAPTGWLACNGAALSRTTYAGLFAIIGTAFGSGDGSTTFNLPNFAGTAPVGLGTAPGGSIVWARGSRNGEETHTLTTGELPYVQGPQGSNADNGDPGSLVVTAASQPNGGYPAAFGANTPHNNVQPSLGVNFIIKY